MKWIILVVISICIVFLGLSNPVAGLDAAWASNDQYQTKSGLQIQSTVAPSATPQATATPSPVKVSQSNGLQAVIDTVLQIFLPIIRMELPPTPVPLEPKEFLVCSSPGKGIPDNTATGLRADLELNEQGVITDLEVYVRTSHPYVGDLSIELVQRGPDKTTAVQGSVLVDRPGLANNILAAKASTSLGCELDNIQAIFDSQAEQFAENKCQSGSRIGVAIGGTFKAQSGLDQFRGQPGTGTWSLLVADNAAGDVGTLDKWCLHGWTDDTALPVTPPPPPDLPAYKVIGGVTGQHQALPLDCEIRSAVDWAKFFGKTIDEMEFLNGLPKSDNPDKGFVGNVNGTWGQIPPNDYGVHAEPVAARLRAYGVTADARRGMRFDELRAEIAKGNPVIVWIVGNVDWSAPEYYQAQSDQGISIVAKYEHTVIAYGYDQDFVYVLNGSGYYKIGTNRFLDSWSALGNMAIVAQP